VVCFFSAIFMNINPLMKFDGYFALSDYLVIPNLRSRSRKYLSSLIQSKIFRLARQPEHLGRREQLILVTYGLLSVLYMINVLFGLTALVTTALVKYLHLVGLLIAIALVIKFFGSYLRKSVNLGRVIMSEHHRFFKRTSVRATALVSITALVLAFFLYRFPSRLQARSSLEPKRSTVVRTLSSGYVKSLATNNQQFVRDQVILELENPDLSARIVQLKSLVHQKEVEERTALAMGQNLLHTEIIDNRLKLQEELEELKVEHANLTVRALHDGVMEGDLSNIEHRQVGKGHEIGRLQDTSVFRANMEVAEKDLEGLQTGLAARLLLDVRPWQLLEGTVSEIAPLHQKHDLERTYKIMVDFPNRDLLLCQGLKGTVFLKVGEFNGFERLVRWLKRTVRLDLQF